jgi:hypothetical protein
MVRRILGAGLWFLAIWFAYEVVWSATGLPRAFGPALAGLVAYWVTRSLESRAPAPVPQHAAAAAQLTN